MEKDKEMDAYLYLLVLIIILFNIYISIRVFKSIFYEKKQKTIQILIVWF